MHDNFSRIENIIFHVLAALIILCGIIGMIIIPFLDNSGQLITGRLTISSMWSLILVLILHILASSDSYSAPE